MKKQLKIILSGGGTGGHIYPAVAVAEALKKRLGAGVRLLFVGAEGKMEMTKIPTLGYEIVGLPVAGLQRKADMRNLLLPFKVARSLWRARRVIRQFEANAVVGFGGYASAPVLWSAQRMALPTVIQEQNSYAGLSNKLLSKRAERICVAYEGMERFFPASKIVMTGNPLRGNFSDCRPERLEALRYFVFTDAKPTLLVVGGSLGTRTLNNMMKRWVDEIVNEGAIQVIWQTGAYYEREMEQFMSERPSGGIWRGAFIDRMDYAYAAADLVISRSGAITVSELSLLGKAVMFVPSPNVAEDHQRRNAMALVERNAAEICPDHEAVERGIPTAIALLEDGEKLAELARNIAELGIADSAERVVDEILATIR
jgi:UDP-N-acetylglucosamine--N-acetylmuramyl-(pentapeptide) pyrophosphoryl-undecaprenol N-acetylglucosamine transferase